MTRAMLEGLDRPVRCEPEWFGPEKKDALIRDFEHYLGILKAVSGWLRPVPCAACGGG